MGFKYTENGQIYKTDTLIIKTQNNFNNITVVNNEAITFDFSAFKNDYIKIIIDFGDDSNKSYILKPLYASSGSISIDTINWATIKHHYSFKNEDDFSKDYTKIIKIDIYAIDETKHLSFNVKYNVEKGNISGISRKLTLLSANLRNDDKVAYTIQNDSDRQIIFFTSEN